MASNDKWVPLPQKKNGSNKKSKENQIKTMHKLKEMFGETFESDIIESVAQNCNWKLEQTIETLIILSSVQTTVQPRNECFAKLQKSECESWPTQKYPNTQIQTNVSEANQENTLNINQNELIEQRELHKFENTKCIDGRVIHRLSSNDPCLKVGTASLCGLKVQYRLKGTENSDDDADVVIEEESSDYRIETPELHRVNVCQFLSAPTECPPRNTFPKVNYIETPSSPHRTTQHIPSVVLPTISSRIEEDINKGYKIMILMRGPSGSGKSYLARSIVSRTMGGDFAGHIFSADDYFKVDGVVYVFDSSKLKDAHSFNQNRVLNAMEEGRSPIFIDNTNIKAWEMQNYATMATVFGYIVETLEPDTPWFRNAHELERRNVHGVPKVKIRMMLDRYEPNINGERLLKMFSLKYAEHNIPPQIRRVPPYYYKQMNSVIDDLIAERQDDCQFRNPTHDDRAERLIDSEALNTIAKEYAKPESVSINTSSSNTSSVAKSFNESWTAGSSYKEDSLLLEMMKLGAIGSERRLGQVGVEHPQQQESDKEHVQEAPKQEADQEASLKVVPEKTVSKDYEVMDKINSEMNKDSSMSNCWDFTLLLNGMQIHSKFEDTHNNELAEPIEKLAEVSDLKNNVVEDTEVSCILASKVNNDFSSIQEPRAQSLTSLMNLTDLQLDDKYEEPTSDGLEEIPTPSGNTRSHSDSSSLERVSDVDLSQFEMCNTEVVDDAKISNEKMVAEETSAEKPSASGGLGLLFSYIKNSIIGNDKEKCSNQSQRESTDTPEVYISCTEQFDKLTNDNSLGKKTLPMSILSHKPVHSSEEDLEANDSSLPIDIGSPSDCINDSLLNVSLEESNEFFGTLESPQKESVVNVVEELLEASSDVQQVEQDSTERKPATKSEELEKNISERMENLHIRAKSDEDVNKVSKEPIHLAFSGKNIFPEKMQANSNNAGSSSGGVAADGDNGTSSVANIYLINWHESPLPLEEVPSSNASDANVPTIKPKPETCERGTYTDPYDFNVAYVGGTDEYKIIEGFSRNIVDPNRYLSSDIEEPLMQKLMLHKGTMTNTTILFKGPIFDLDVNDNSEDFSQELLHRFSHLPRACVLDVYENLCRRDYSWAFDYLSNMQEDNIIMYEGLEQNDIATSATNLETAERRAKEVTTPQAITKPDSSVSETCELPRQLSEHPQTRSKRERYRASGDLLALKQELEDKFVMSEESYAPHTLRVKRWKRGEFDEPEISAPDFNSFIEQPAIAITEPRKPSRLDHPAAEEDEEEQRTEDEDSMEYEALEEEMMELRLGYEFIRVLETEFGSANFQAPEGLFPVIQIRRSMAQELHALWIESVQQQLWVMQEQLDTMIAKDADYARTLEIEEVRGASAQSDVPNLKEIMDMEMALATYSNDCVKQKFMKKTRNDLACHVTQQTLHDMFPGYDSTMLYEIYEAHDRNFDETVKVIEENCSIKSTITMADVLKKRKNLIDELQKESSYQTSRHNQLEPLETRDEASGGDEFYDNLQTYEEAIEVAHCSRAEARRQLALRNENYQKASEAYRRRNPEVAAYYSDVAKLHIRNMEAANSMATAAFLTAQTHVLEADDTLDLHFLHVPEAVQTLDLFLEHQMSQLAKGARKYVFIITGRGARSSNGQSKIKPVIVKKLNSKNIGFSEANPGMLKVLLRKK